MRQKAPIAPTSSTRPATICPAGSGIGSNSASVRRSAATAAPPIKLSAWLTVRLMSVRSMSLSSAPRPVGTVRSKSAMSLCSEACGRGCARSEAMNPGGPHARAEDHHTRDDAGRDHGAGLHRAVFVQRTEGQENAGGEEPEADDRAAGTQAGVEQVVEERLNRIGYLQQKHEVVVLPKGNGLADDDDGGP